jgi:hypothetical protein
MIRKVLFGGLILWVVCAAAAVPDLNGGTWQAINPPKTLRTIEGKEPPLLPAAKAIYEKHLAARKASDLAFDTTDRCLPPGLPRVLYMPASFEFLQRSEEITILYEWNRLLRTVEMNVAPGEIPWPTYLGRSVGRWQGQTLIIDTTGFTDNTLLDTAGLPHSDALRVTEKYTPSADGNRMTVRIAIDDPKMYSKPWETALELKRNPKGEINEDVCFDRQGVKWGDLKPGT